MSNETYRWEEPIAIVSMACRLPGGINRPNELWEFVCDRRSSAADVPDTRFNADKFLSMDPNRQGLPGVSRGHFIDRGLQEFDYRLFGITHEDALAMDPQHKQLLEVVYDCLELTGNPMGQIKGTNIGCYCSIFTSDYHDMQMRDPENLPMFLTIGTTRSMLANRISYAFDLRGPSITLDTACSSSLVALHVACQALHARDCDGAVVGATNLFLNPEIALAMTRFGIVAPDGQTKTFDADAHGYGRAEAINAVYLKRLSDALRDGDNIRGVIRATSTNSDGATSAITVPSASAQADAITRAYSQAHIEDLDQTGYFECHGTGTPTGDPLEVSAVSSVFGPHRDPQDPLWIGSTKPNIGHSEAASGLSSVIKIVLALEKGTIPPNANFDIPSPKIDFKKLKVDVATESQPWPSKKVRRASINSFGIGGSNAHIIIDSFQRPRHDFAPVSSVTTIPKDSDINHPYLITVTGASKQSLNMNIATLLKFFKEHDGGPNALPQVTQMLNNRNQLPYKFYSIARTMQDLITALESHDAGTVSSPVVAKNPGLAFIFTGQGAFWAPMGKGLIDIFPVARVTLGHLDGYLSSLQQNESRKWSLVDKLTNKLSPSELSCPALGLTLCTAIQIALTDVLASWNVRPDVVVGHSAGEIAAAYSCGAITAKEAIAISYYRGTVVEKAERGSMMAVNCGDSCQELQSVLRETGASIACYNSPQNITLSGPVDAIQTASRMLANKELVTRTLPVSRAYHTRMMIEPAAEYYEILKGIIHPNPADIPMYSAVSGQKANWTELDAQYWQKNLCDPVRFTQAIQNILHTEPRCGVFVEIGPHRLFSQATREAQKFVDSHAQLRPYLSTMIRDSDTSYHMMKLAGDLALNGVPLALHEVNWKATRLGRNYQHVPPTWLEDLPSYAWDYSVKTWREPRTNTEWRFRKAPRHELLGTRVPGSNPLVPMWENYISQGQLPWVIDHQVKKTVMLPMTAYVAMAIEAVMQILEEHDMDLSQTAFQIENLTLTRPLVLPDEAAVDTIVTLDFTKSQHKSRLPSWAEFMIASRNGETAINHCWGIAKIVPVNDLGFTRANFPYKPLPLEIPVTKFYNRFEKIGHAWGPAFRLLSEPRSLPGTAQSTAQVIVPPKINLQKPGQRYMVHPTVLDAIVQTAPLSQMHGYYQDFNLGFLPSKVGEIKLRVPSPDTSVISCATSSISLGHKLSSSMIECMDGQDSPFINIRDFHMESQPGENEGLNGWIRLTWRPDVDELFRNASTSSLIPRGSATADDIKSLECMVGQLCVLIEEAGFKLSENSPPYMDLYLAWIRHRAAHFRKQNRNTTLCFAGKTSSFGDSVSNLISNMNLTDTPDVSLAVNVARNIKGVIEGTTEVLAVMLEENLLYKLYDSSLTIDHMNQQIYFTAELLAHNNPRMKILEIGAGTGGTTQRMLQGLNAIGGNTNYESYTFTDISAGFFEQAKRKFAKSDRLGFQTLDIEKEPSQQGFVEKYDLIVASNVLHATSNMEDTMKNVRALLQDGGRFLLAELSGDLMATGFFMGGLPGWWIRSQSPTQPGPGLTFPEWKELHVATGFSSPYVLPGVMDEETQTELTYASVMMAHAIPSPPTSKVSSLPTVHIAGPSATIRLQHMLRRYLENCGFNITCSSLAALADRQWSGEWLVLLDTAHESVLSSLQTKELEALKMWLNKPIHCIWVTRNVHLEPKNASGGLVTGFARTIRNENDQLHLYTVDFSSSPDDAVVEILQNFIVRISSYSGDAHANLDYELAEKDGQLYSSRLERDSQRETVSGSVWMKNTPVGVVPHGSFSLSINEVGMLDSFLWLQEEQADMVPEDYLLLEVKAVGVDSRDGLVACGLTNCKEFGRECSGIVKKCGSNITGFQPGDRVVAIGEGTFRTQYLAPAVCCRKIPVWIPFEHAAPLPATYITAWHALVEVSHISSNQRILITDGSTSMGVAAMQIAKLFGADVTTIITNNEDKCLAEKCGVAVSNTFILPPDPNSTQLTDAMGSRRYGTIVNPNPSQYEQFAPLLSLGGIYLDICVGAPLRSLPKGINPITNTIFTTIDLGYLYLKDREYLGKLLSKVMDYVESGEIKLIMPISVMELQDVKAAFSAVVEGEHKRPVIIFTSSNEQQAVYTRSHPLCFSEDKTYIITGGLGGLGRALAVWMASRGAKHLVLMTRSISSAIESKGLLEDLRAYGCKGSVAVCNVAERADVARVISSINTPIGGIVHSALKLSDRALVNMAMDDYKSVLDPKVLGSWNIHQELRNEDLDFFVMLSSGCGIVGNESQANYAASSTFLDSFARYRQHLGLPAASIDLGYIENIGYVSQNQSVKAHLSSTGLRPLSEKDFLETVEAAMAVAPHSMDDYCFDPYANSQIIRGFELVHVESSQRQTWFKDAKFASLRPRSDSGLAEPSGGPDSGENALHKASTEFRSALRRLTEAPSGEIDIISSLQPIIYSALVSKLTQVLSIDVGVIKPSQSAAEYGMDSLMAIHVRSWARAALFIDLQVSEIMSPYSINNLSGILAERVKAGRASRNS